MSPNGSNLIFRRACAVVLKNLDLSGHKGLTIAYANVTGTKVDVHAEVGDAIIRSDGANLTLP